MTQRERIYRALSERDNDDLLELVDSINSYSGGLTELELLPMDELTDWLTNWGERLDSSRLDSLLYQTRCGDFDERDPYFRFDAYNDPVSSDGDYSWSDIDDIAEYIDDNADELDCWGLNDDLADSIRAALDDPEDEDDADDEDEDIELLPREDIAAVLADWYTDTERARPANDELRRIAARCEAQERPLDPADVRGWADFRLTLGAQAPRQPA
jgi:hypothetical protein